MLQQMSLRGPLILTIILLPLPQHSQSLMCRSYIIDALIRAWHPIVGSSLHLDEMEFSLVVSAPKISFCVKDCELHLLLGIRISI